MERRRVILANGHSESDSLFPITLVVGDNGQVGVDLFEYIVKNGEWIKHSSLDFYMFKYIIPEEIYAQYQSYDAWKLTQVNGQHTSGVEFDFPDNSLIESLSFQNANGVPAYIVLDRNGKLSITIYG